MPSLSEGGTTAAAGGSKTRATVLGAFLEGWRRVMRAPILTVGVLVLTFGVTLPMAVALRASMVRHLGASLEADRATGSWNELWAQEFAADSGGLDGTFTHEILGFGGTLLTLSRIFDAEPVDPVVAGAIGTYLVLWIFLAGGILDRIARGRAVRPVAFFGACGGYFLRFSRLAVPVGFAYWALFHWLHPLLFTTLYDRWTRDLTVEPYAVLIRAALYVTFAVALASVSVVADFAKVRIVVEDRRSVIGALGAAWRFIRRRPARLAGLYALNIAAAAIIARLWLQTAPSAAMPLWLALLGAELHLVVRVWARLAFMASEIVFFQGELAHATFTRAPEPIWPDSPTVEAINNLRNR